MRHLFGVLESRTTLVSYAAMGCAMMGGFMVIPNISAHFQFNLGYPRENLGLLYLVGGIVSFFGMRLSGKIMDRYSATKASILFSAILIAAIATGFVFFPLPISPLLIFTCFMVGMSGRNISVTALSSKVPPPSERGAYMSLQSTVTNLASATGGYYSSLILSQQGDKLQNVPAIGLTAIALCLCVPFLIAYVESQLRKRA